MPDVSAFIIGRASRDPLAYLGYDADNHRHTQRCRLLWRISPKVAALQGWQKRSVPTIFMQKRWTRRKRAFAHPLQIRIASSLPPSLFELRRNDGC